MIAQVIGLEVVRFAPPARVAAVFREYAHDVWAMRNELQEAFRKIAREDPKWMEEFRRECRRRNVSLPF